AVEKLAGEPGEMLDLDRVLLIAGNGDGEPRIGSPGVAGAVVRAEVLAHFRGEKIIVFRYKSKVRYRRKTGHRQALTRLRITDILLDGASSSKAARTEAPRAQKAESAVAETPPPEAEVSAAPAPTRRRRAAPAPESPPETPVAAAEAESETEESEA